MPTFAELGIPFPLFEADSGEATIYRGRATCALCGVENAHCFKADFVVVHCPDCNSENGLRADEGKDSVCRACGHLVPFRPLARDEYRHIRVCCTCLQAGKAAVFIDTVLGAVGWDEAVAGQTMSRPDTGSSRICIADGKHIVRSTQRAEDSPYGFERVLIARSGALANDPEQEWMDWYATRVPPEVLIKLVRTPTYSTWQGEHWQFCCQQPMIYVGAWAPRDFDTHAPDGNGRALFDQVVPNADDRLWQGQYDAQGIYVFRCAECGQYKAHWDMA